MEQLLHYVWKHKIFPLMPLRTTSGQPVEVIDPGLPNPNAGPDFFNAKLKIDNMLWVGNVELHTQASDWFRHGHDRNTAYDNVILHVVGVSDCEVHRTNGDVIAQLQLCCPESIRCRYAELRQAEAYPPCHSILSSLPKLTVHSWLSALQVERFERKAQDIAVRLERCNNHWEDVFFITLARNFGFGLNGDAFEAWAGHLPLRAVDKHRDSLFQVEAFFLDRQDCWRKIPSKTATIKSSGRNFIICSISSTFLRLWLPDSGVFFVCVPITSLMCGWHSLPICIIRSSYYFPALWRWKHRKT